MPDAPACAVWAWFMPPQAPHDVLFQIADDVYRAFCTVLTLRRLLAAAGIPLQEAVSWTVQGMSYPVQGGMNPLLDQPVPPPGPAGIAVKLRMPSDPIAAAVAPMPVASGSPEQSSAPPSAGARSVLEAIDAEWQSIILLERQLDALRRQLSGVQGTMQTLNRDLDPDERLYSDSMDKKDWSDTRRWLRDALAHVSKAIRSHDIGVTSAAGSRRRFEQLYKDYVEPRRPFPGMEAEQLAFEQHRKTTQSLLQQMQSTHAFATRDGIQRAQQVLARIAVRVRAARAKR